MKKLVLTLSLGLILSTAIWAQPQGPGAPVPFGAIELLLLAGAGFGAKKIFDKNKKGSI